MHPVDTSELDEKSASFYRKRDLKDEINELKNKQDKLPELERGKESTRIRVRGGKGRV